MAKLNITMPDDLLVALDEYVTRNFTTRSGAITLMVNNYLTSQQAVASIRQISTILQQVAAGKELTEEEQMQLDGFSALARVLPK